MSLILSGTDGLSDVDGTAATPAIRGTDANTGIFFGTDIIGFSEGGVEAARINADSQFVAAAGTAALPVITTTGDTNTGIFFPAADTIAFAEGGVESARFDSSGNLLVGTTTASAKITVSAANGTTPIIGVSNTTSGNAYGYASSLQTAANNTSSYHYHGSTLAVGNWYLYGNGVSSWSSDERLKHNIQTTRDGYIEDVCKLRVVKYQWKNGPQQVELGLIAQEVEQIFPGLVQDDLNPISPDDPILYKQLKGSVLPMILLKAIQEQQTLITALTARITALETP